MSTSRQRTQNNDMAQSLNLPKGKVLNTKKLISMEGFVILKSHDLELAIIVLHTQLYTIGSLCIDSEKTSAKNAREDLHDI